MRTRTTEFEKVTRRFPDLTIGILGDVMLDELVRGEATRISPEAPVPVLLVRGRGSREAFPGGAGNVASNVAALGARAVMFGAVGGDDTARRLKGLLEERSIDTRNLVQEPARMTPRKVRIAAHQHQLLRLDFEQPQTISARSERLLTRRFARCVAGLDALIVSDYLKGSVTTALCAEIVTRARQRRLPVLVDPKPERPEICRHATVATPNLKEAEMMAGTPLSDAENRRTGAPMLRAALGCEALLITRGGDGMTLVERNGGYHEVPSHPRPVYDVTGAGDTVIAVMALALAAGAPMRQAAAMANLASGRVVLKFGTATLTPAEFLDALRS